MRSFSVKSLRFLTPGLMLLSHNGIEFRAAIPLTLRLSLVRAQIVTSGPTPPEAKSRLPEINASFMGGPPVKRTHSALRSSPRFLPSASSKFFSAMMVIGK